MLSSISSYIWGGNAMEESEQDQSVSTPTTTPPRRDSSPVVEDWVLVGNQPAPGNLTGLHPLPPVTPSTNSSASSNIGEEEGQEEVDQLVGQDSNTRVPVRASHDHSVGLKSLKSAQICKQRNSGKALSSKALKRSNKAVINNGKKKESCKYSMPIKSAGFNKNLKQC